MCGILGGYDTDLDRRSLSRLAHRGPDQCGLWTAPVAPAGTVTLGQTRLNIVDRRPIDLPVCVGDARIVFNGEIYNHPELRSELESFGWTFHTRTDTEVALAAYLQWGPACLERFNGMFALAVWDGRRFFCARDRLGQKPFFYRCGGGSFSFASEVKAFPEPAFVSQELFDLFEFCFDESTLYRDVLSLPPAHYLTYDPVRGDCRVQPYWDIPHRVDRKLDDPRKAVGRFIELLEDAVRLRLRADVEVGMFLSGGVDSALIARLAGVREAFTCQFDEFRGQIDEQRYAADLAERLGITLHVVRPTREMFLRDLPRMAYHLEMPTGSFSVFPLYRLAAQAHHAGYKVVLSGEGSDELFAGYTRNEFLLADVLDVSSPRRAQYRAMLQRYHGDALDRFCRMASRSGLAGAAAMKMFLTRLWNPHKSVLDNLCYLETRIFLQPLLQMADRMGMAHAVEVRSPFLDHRIVEFAFSLDDSLRYRDGRGKWIVHEAARRLLPPGSAVLSRPVKHGLPTPVNLWLQGRHSFDRRYWNTIMTAECIKALLAESGAVLKEASRRTDEVAAPASVSSPGPVQTPATIYEP